MQILMNSGGGTFGAPVPLAAGSTTTRVAAGNFKGGGVLGLAVTSFDNIDTPEAPAPTLYTVDATCSPQPRSRGRSEVENSLTSERANGR